VVAKTKDYNKMTCGKSNRIKSVLTQMSVLSSQKAVKY